MTERSPDLTPSARRERDTREVRLARALRENLRRRKEQIRARSNASAGRPGKDAEDGEPAS